jgi:adenylyltransferase/sulfurtransferase
MSLTQTEYSRYSRHILLQEVGKDGQLALKKSKVLVVGAGGLGCPVLLYLSAAGVGTIGIIDGDSVQLSNLQRQTIYTVPDIGKPKSSTAANRLQERNPLINYEIYDASLTPTNASEIILKYDIIIDCTDNFAARYLINDACVLFNKPFIHGSLHKFNGQVAVFNFQYQNGIRSSTYRCMFPTPPLLGGIQNCSEIGVLGVLPGIIGTLQATEAIKIILGIGVPLVNSLLIVNALTMKFDTIDVLRNELNWGKIPHTENELSTMDYDSFCGVKNANHIKELTSTDLLIELNNKENIQIIDIRNDDEFPNLETLLPLPYIPRRIPLIRLIDSIESINSTDKTIIVCQSGSRSKSAIQQLQNEYGYSNLYSLKGGILDLLTVSTQ